MVSVSAAAGICAFWPNGVTKEVGGQNSVEVTLIVTL